MSVKRGTSREFKITITEEHIKQEAYNSYNIVNLPPKLIDEVMNGLNQSALSSVWEDMNFWIGEVLNKESEK